MSFVCHPFCAFGILPLASKLDAGWPSDSQVCFLLYIAPGRFCNADGYVLDRMSCRHYGMPSLSLLFWWMLHRPLVSVSFHPLLNESWLTCMVCTTVPFFLQRFRLFGWSSPQRDQWRQGKYPLPCLSWLSLLSGLACGVVIQAHHPCMCVNLRFIE